MLYPSKPQKNLRPEFNGLRLTQLQQKFIVLYMDQTLQISATDAYLTATRYKGSAYTGGGRSYAHKNAKDILKNPKVITALKLLRGEKGKAD